MMTSLGSASLSVGWGPRRYVASSVGDHVVVEPWLGRMLMGGQRCGMESFCGFIDKFRSGDSNHVRGSKLERESCIPNDLIITPIHSPVNCR